MKVFEMQECVCGCVFFCCVAATASVIRPRTVAAAAVVAACTEGDDIVNQVARDAAPLQVGHTVRTPAVTALVAREVAPGRAQVQEGGGCGGLKVWIGVAAATRAASAGDRHTGAAGVDYDR